MANYDWPLTNLLHKPIVFSLLFIICHVRQLYEVGENKSKNFSFEIVLWAFT